MNFWWLLIVVAVVVRGDDGTSTPPTDSPTGATKTKSETLKDKETSSPKNDFITFDDAEKMSTEGKYFMLAIVSKKSPRCIELMSTIPAINSKLARINASLAMYLMDAEDQPVEEIGDERIMGVPTIFLYIGEEVIRFSGSPQTDFIVRFAKLALSAKVSHITSQEDRKALEQSSYASVIVALDGDGDGNVNGPQLNGLLKIARRNFNATFGYVLKNSPMAKEIGSAAYVHREGDGTSTLGEVMSTPDLEKFVRDHTHRPLFEFPGDSHAMSDIKERGFVFYVDNMEGIKEVSPWFKDLGNKLRGKFAMFTCNKEDPDMEMIMSYFKIRKDSPARVRLLLKYRNMFFRMEDAIKEPISKNSVMDFLNLYEKGSLRAYLESARLPSNWDKKPLKTLVASNFEEVVLQGDKTVIVLLYDRSDKKSKNLIPIMDKLANRYEKFGEILLAKMDMKANHMPHSFSPVRKEKLPEIRSYEKFTNMESLYNREKTLEGLDGYIKGAILKFHDPRKPLPKFDDDEEKEAKKTEEEVEEKVAEKAEEKDEKNDEEEKEIPPLVSEPDQEVKYEEKPIISEIKDDQHEEL
ncbi:hypothetical protein Q1695_005558 [Nippostrongylus brasiliensis]|nr:hypothetical protein Q1695_005558 [Nippostrongylus brasiliensis]